VTSWNFEPTRALHQRWGDQNRSLSHERYSSSPSKTHRAAMGFSFPGAGRVKRAKACSTENHTVNAYKSPHAAAKTKEKPAGVNRPHRLRPDAPFH
jgi:hypothetical protein